MKCVVPERAFHGESLNVDQERNMDWSPNVKNVLVQATYMSGDRNGIASALHLDRTLGVLILTEPGALQSGNELLRFYSSIAGQGRVRAIAVPSVPGLTARKSLTKAYGDAKGRLPPWLSRELGGRGPKFQTATFGTRVIADTFTAANAMSAAGVTPAVNAARDKLQKLWGLKGDLGPKVIEWLEKKLIPADPEVDENADKNAVQPKTVRSFNKDKRYVFLFAKQGDRSAEKAHHFTSILTWNLLKDRIDQYYQQNSYQIIPVAAGDRIGLQTDPDLAEFWRDDAWIKMMAGSGVDPRSAQLGLWTYFATRYRSVSIIGMRSGMIEVPALVGIRTLYLEEAFNAQADRMKKWLDGVVPGFERKIVDAPPGIAQGLYWKQHGAKGPNGDPARIRGQVVRTALTGLQTGFPRPVASNLQNSGWPTVQPESAALNPPSSSPAVDPGIRSAMSPVLNQIPGKGIDNFMLQEAALDEIMTWICAAPQPNS